MKNVLLLSCVILISCGKIQQSEDTLSSPWINQNKQPVQAAVQKDIELYQELSFDHLTKENGLLSQINTMSIAQDKTGFLWFATEYGLNRFDGSNTKVYLYDAENQNTISSNWIWELLADSKGNLWLGTLNGGLDRYSPVTDRFFHYRYNEEDEESISSDEINILHEDQAGNLWIGCRNGLNLYRENTDDFLRFSHSETDEGSILPGEVRAITSTSDGTLWIGTKGGGVCIRKPGETAFTAVLNDGELSSDQIEVIFEDSKGNIWIGTKNGLNRMAPDRSVTRYFHEPGNSNSLSDDYITDIVEDSNGFIWIGTFNNGLNCMDPESSQFLRFRHEENTKESLSDNNIADLFIDKEGILWVATPAGGVNKVYLEGLQFSLIRKDVTIDGSPKANQIFGIAESEDGTLWVGSHNGLGKYINGEWELFKSEPDDPTTISSSTIGDITISHDGLIWVGTFGGGLNVLNPVTEAITKYPSSDVPDSQSLGIFITEILEDRENRIWLGTVGNGITIYDRENSSFTTLLKNENDVNSISSNQIYSLYQDSAGLLWIGYLNAGLSIYDIDEQEFTHFRTDADDQNSLSNNMVTVILEDRFGTMWLGTGSGLNRFNRESKNFISYTEEDGLVGDIIYGMLSDENGDLWLSTMEGIQRFDPVSEIFEVFDTEDGLQGSEFNAWSYFKNSSGRMFFGGMNGINTFYPESIGSINTYAPPIVLTQFNTGELSLKAIDENNTIELKWPNHSFDFEFAALSYVNPQENEYAYLLKGFDSDWNFTGIRNYGRYTNLSGGDYTLLLAGTNNAGYGNTESINIKIIPPFWQTWVFRILIFVILIGMIFLFAGLRVRRIAARNRALEKIVEERTKELSLKMAEEAVFKERNRLARELHDSVTQSLHGAMLLAEAGTRIADQKNIGKAKEYFSRLNEISLQALKEMRLLIYELRPERLREVGLEGALQHRIKAVENRAGIDVSLDLRITSDLPALIEDAFFKVARESLNNAVKYSRSDKIHISISNKEENGADFFTMVIEDNGVGFDRTEVQEQGGLGLKTMEEHILEIDGSLEIVTSPGEGTKIIAVVCE